MDELTIGDKIYISSKRAAAITGYAKDYVGQLCREGHIEAKMVGRSWYVLESSIRAHRFGTETVTQPEKKAEAPVPSVEDLNLPETWSAPIYVPEVAPAMPELVQPDPIEANKEEEAVESKESLTEMQEAWKEWFENKQAQVAEEPVAQTYVEVEPEEEAETEPEPSYEAEEQAIPIPVHKIRPVIETYPGKMDIQPVQPAPVAATPIYVPAPEPKKYAPPVAVPRPRRERRHRSGGSNLVTIALMIAFALIVVVVSYIGSGFGSPYIGTNPVFEFLGGTSSISK